MGNKDVQPPPPLPKNELKDLSTKEDVADAAIPSPEPLPVPVVKEEAKVEAGVPKDVHVGDAKELSEEEKVRKELFPDDAK